MRASLLRVLCALLDAGFEGFVRVGSVRKISLRVLPYSVSGRESSHDETRELKAAMAEAGSAEERAAYARELEEQASGRARARKDLLGSARVVGVTVSSSVQACLDKQVWARPICWPRGGPWGARRPVTGNSNFTVHFTVHLV